MIKFILILLKHNSFYLLFISILNFYLNKSINIDINNNLTFLWNFATLLINSSFNLLIFFPLFFINNINRKLIFINLFILNKLIFNNINITFNIKYINSLLNGLFLIHPMLIYISFFFVLSYIIKLSKKIKLFSKIIFFCHINIKYVEYFKISILSISLGSWWAGQELGWGGWWSWDFIEIINFILLFYFLFKIHNKDLNIFESYNIKIKTLIIIILFHIFTRFDIVQSIHSFLTSNNSEESLIIIIIIFLLFKKKSLIKFFFKLDFLTIININMFAYILLIFINIFISLNLSIIIWNFYLYIFICIISINYLFMFNIFLLLISLIDIFYINSVTILLKKCNILIYITHFLLFIIIYFYLKISIDEYSILFIKNKFCNIKTNINDLINSLDFIYNIKFFYIVNIMYTINLPIEIFSYSYIYMYDQFLKINNLFNTFYKFNWFLNFYFFFIILVLVNTNYYNKNINWCI